MPLTASRGTGAEQPDFLMLLRATNLKMLRLHLAMERQDRPVVLAAVDDLVALDRQLQDYLAAGAWQSDDQLMFRRELEQERALLNREKLTLAAEVLRRPPPCERLAEPSVDECQAQEEWVAEEYGDRRKRRGMLIAVPVLATAAAVAAYVLGLPDLRPWLAAGGLG